MAGKLLGPTTATSRKGRKQVPLFVLTNCWAVPTHTFWSRGKWEEGILSPGIWADKVTLSHTTPNSKQLVEKGSPKLPNHSDFNGS